ncbi:unnamed protein product [Lactuca saligna]|uniref:Uncharacterized protein n=1 Tax=Lactuca saligna TaxID=75948 RepID=A0AA35UL36_LACSI|nr:unnamed protein product [Lactuca saligna]
MHIHYPQLQKASKFRAFFSRRNQTGVISGTFATSARPTCRRPWFLYPPSCLRSSFINLIEQDLVPGTSRPLSELKTPEEVATTTNSKDKANIEESECEFHPDAVEKPSKPVSEGVTEAEEVKSYIAIREELYKKAKEFDSKIIDFETAIRRPYLHQVFNIFFDNVYRGNRRFTYSLHRTCEL